MYRFMVAVMAALTMTACQKLEETAQTAEQLAQEAQQAAGDAADQVTGAVEDTAAAVEEAGEAAGEAVTGAVSDAEKTAAAAAAQTMEAGKALTEAVGDATSAAVEAGKSVMDEASTTETGTETDKTAGSDTAAGSTVTVQQGDTLSGIAARTYGSADAWQGIYEANRNIVSDPDLILPGQELVVPAR